MTIPKNLTGPFTEAINRTEIDSVMLRRGYIPFLPVVDGGIDVIYFRERDRDLRFVQAKGRIGIYRKYFDRKIEIAFSEAGQWYLYPHDSLVDFCNAKHLWTHTSSWRNKNEYHSKKIPPSMREWMAQWELD